MLGTGLVSLLYPQRCAVCRDFGEEIICSRCRNAFVPLSDAVCKRCGVELDPETSRGPLCSDCRGLAAYHFTWARARGRFDGTLRTAIHRLKYDGRRPVARVLGEWMRGEDDSGLIPPRPPDVVVPVPLHWLRRWQRGFNQSLLLAQAYVGDRDWPIEPDILRRTRNTRPQVMLPAEQRAANVRNAFAVTDADRVKGRRVLIVDDVLTTMHTVIECSRVLKRAGAAEVYVAAVAR